MKRNGIRTSMVRVTIWQIDPAHATVSRRLVFEQAGGGDNLDGFNAVSYTQIRPLEIPYKNQSVARNWDFLKKAC